MIPAAVERLVHDHRQAFLQRLGVGLSGPTGPRKPAGPLKYCSQLLGLHGAQFHGSKRSQEFRLVDLVIAAQKRWPRRATCPAYLPRPASAPCRPRT